MPAARALATSALLASLLGAAPAAAGEREAEADDPRADRAGFEQAGDRSPDAPPGAVVRPRVDLPLEIEVHGQLFFGVTADARRGWDRDAVLDRARIEVRGRLPRVLTVIEADVSSDDPLRDAFVRFDGPATTRLTAGRFKAPFIERETRSAWSLPLVDRGMVTDELVGRSGLGGRRLGAVGEVRPWDGALEVAAGIFQGSTVTVGDQPREDYAARVAARPWGPLEVGVSGYHALSESGPVRQAGSGFAVVRLGPLTGTFEALAGELAQGRFTAGVGLLEYTLRLTPLRITPVAGFEALRLRGAAPATGAGAVLGAVLGAGRGLKLKLQWERARRPEEEAPESAIALELATRF